MNNSSHQLESPIVLSFLLSQNKLRCINIVNDTEVLTGYSCQAILSGSINLKNLFHPDDSDIFQTIFSPATLVQPISLTFRIIHKNGLPQILKASYIKQFNSKQDETTIELSLQKPGNLALSAVSQSAESNFIAMLENTNDYIYFKDRNHVFTGASQTLVNITDPTEQWTDLIGKTDYDVFPREYADNYYSLEKQVFSGDISVAQEIQPIVDKSGNKGWVDNRKYPIKDQDGYITGLFGIARDITDIKHAEEALRTSELSLKQAQDVAKMGSWVHDMLSDDLTWSGGIYQILEIDSLHVSASYKLFIAAIHPDDRHKTHAVYIESIETGLPYNIRYRMCMADGRIKYIQEQCKIFYNAENKAVKSIGTIQDITREQRPRELISKLTHDFAHFNGKQFFEAVCQYISETMSLDYMVVGLFSDSGTQVNVVAGWGLGAPISTFSYDLIDTPCEKIQRTNCISTSQNVPVDFPNNEFLMQMGIESYAGVPLFDKNHKKLGIFVALHTNKMDNSEEIIDLLEHAATRISSELIREKVANELIEIENRFHHVSLQSRTFLWEIDPDGLYTYCSPEVEQILGFLPEELVGKKHFYDLHPQKNRESFKTLAFSIINQKNNLNNLENQIISKDGTIVWVSTSGLSLTNQSDELIGFQGSDTDITARKLSESREKTRRKGLELMATGKPLEEVLTAIVLNVEKENPSMLCSILLLGEEGKHLFKGAAPSLPAFYNEAIQGLQIGDATGSCGTAAYTGHRVIVDDIQTHPYWAPFKDLAAKAELRACWSEPIYSSQNKVIGTFAIYHHDIHSPNSDDILLIEQTADLASIAIEKEQVNKALQASDARWRFALEGTGGGVWEHNFQTQTNLVSKQVIDMLGISVPISSNMLYELNDWAERLHPESYAETLEKIDAVRNNKTREFEVEQQIRCDDGHYIWLLSRGMLVSKTDKGDPLLIIGTAEDITERKLAELKLQLAANVFSHAKEGIMITDANAIIIDVNETYTTITGYSREESVGNTPKILQSGRQSTSFYKDMWKSLLKEGHWHNEIWNKRKNGEIYVQTLTISAVYDKKGAIKNYVALFSDITHIKEHQKQLEHVAHYDSITNLPNRVLLTDRLSQAMVQCERHKLSLAVAFLDLDGFKSINDNYGHDIGDELLMVISQRMNLALREGDTLARFGGDEFIAVLIDLETFEDCIPILNRLLQAASDPIHINDLVLHVSASIGVTTYPKDGTDTDQLIRHADQAMYIAKQSGKNRYHLFDTALDNAIKTHRESIENIRSALQNRHFVLYYQPKVNMKTRGIIGVEALIRWQHPEKGLLAPLEFLPVIEEHSLSIELGEWVIDTALIQISDWQKQGLQLPISVNIGALQLQQDNFAQRLSKLLRAHPEVAPQQLELEVLETSALGDIVHISAIMNACCELGVRFALDDFGTGYSSLTHLRRLPTSVIKIDQTFVRDMLDDHDDLAIIEGVIGLAKAFHREVIAEGVESVEHGRLLMQLGCELAQGYGIAKPMPAEDISEWVNSWQSKDAWHF